MTTLEWLLVGLILLGIAPAWLIGLAAFISSRKPHFDKPSARYAAYVQVVDRLFAEMDKDKNRAAIMLVCLRELRAYPEYRDITISLLGIINVTGKSHNDRMLMDELKATEDFLLEADNV